MAAIYNVGRRSMKSILEMESGEFEAVGRASCLGGMVFGCEVAARMVPRPRVRFSLLVVDRAASPRQAGPVLRWGSLASEPWRKVWPWNCHQRVFMSLMSSSKAVLQSNRIPGCLSWRKRKTTRTGRTNCYKLSVQGCAREESLLKCLLFYLSAWLRQDEFHGFHEG